MNMQVCNQVSKRLKLLFTKALYGNVPRYALSGVVFMGLSIAACERKPRVECGDGEQLEDGKCVSAAAQEEEEVAAPMQNLQPVGDAPSLKPGDGSDTDNPKENGGKKDVGKGEPTLAPQCSTEPVAQGDTKKESFLKCLFENGGDEDKCATDNGCVVVFATSAECQLELDRLKGALNKATTWSCPAQE